MTTPTLINLPPPPSEPFTPSDIPGTPNSTTTSLSAISTTAIKDGHQGSRHGPSGRNHHHHHTSSTASGSSTNTLDAERADRISRLAGLERIATIRAQSGSPSGGLNPSSSQPPAQHTGASAGSAHVAPSHSQPVGYFDASGNPRLLAARSTVGSASATGSLAGRTTWASSGSMNTEPETEHSVSAMGDAMDTTSPLLAQAPPHSAVVDQDAMIEQDHEQDKMSDTVSSAGLSDGGQESLVGFGEGANSTISGPVSVPRDPVQAARWRAAARGGNTFGATAVGGQQGGAGSGMQGLERTRSTGITGGGPGGSGGLGDGGTGMEGVETAEKIVGERIGDRDGGMRSPDSQGLGRFPFEDR